MKKHTLAMVMSLMCGLFLGAQGPQQSSPSNQTSFASIHNLSEKLENIQNYYEALNTRDNSKWIQTITSDAVINNPIYGQVPASQYLTKLMSARPDYKAWIKNIFINPNDPNMIAVYWARSFSVKGEGQEEDEAVSIFTFAPQSNKIQKVTIIADAQKTREAIQKNRSK